MNIKAMLDEIRKIISRCKASEEEVYEALLEEADGWEMRLEELKKESAE